MCDGHACLGFPPFDLLESFEFPRGFLFFWHERHARGIFWSEDGIGGWKGVEASGVTLDLACVDEVVQAVLDFKGVVLGELGGKRGEVDGFAVGRHEVIEAVGEETAVENVRAIGEEVVGLQGVSTMERDGRKFGRRFRPLDLQGECGGEGGIGIADVCEQEV